MAPAVSSSSRETAARGDTTKPERREPTEPHNGVMTTALAYATDDASAQFHRIEITRRDLQPEDVLLDIRFAGICHSDIHTARGEWGDVLYPLVPGHEIAGVVREVGSAVTRFEPGDRVGIGCFHDSCRECEECENGTEQFCQGTSPDGKRGPTWTYNDRDRYGEPTRGGYSTATVVPEAYLCRIPDEIELDEAAPLLCAGITTYSPLRRFNAGPGMKVAIVGVGGLGHVGVQLATAMGAEVHVISQTRSKEEDAKRFGAVALHPLNEPDDLTQHRASFDLILSTVAADVDLGLLLSLLKTRGTLVDVGLPEHPVSLPFGALTGRNLTLAGSNIGGIAETQEMLDFCAEHGVRPQIEVISGEEITAAYDKVVNSQVRYRYVIDTSTF